MLKGFEVHFHKFWYIDGWVIGGGGVLTDKWYTGMLKGFEVHFHKFWYIDGWVIVTYPMHPICKIGCILENLAKQDGSRTKRLAS